MKIALLGYGKMGKMIEQLSISRSHQIVCVVDGFEQNIDFNGADVAIDFSVPSSAVHHISSAIKAKIPVVSGTTGWLEDFEMINSLVEKENGALVYSSNYSLGVNLFFSLNERLAELIAPYPEYDISAQEIHHTHKLDAPSGTAITLLEGVVGKNKRYTGWQLTDDHTKAGDKKIPVTALRIGATAGTHSIKYSSDIDSIEICHTAHSREGFALGAVIAAEWVKGRKGVFSMKDVIFGK